MKTLTLITALTFFISLSGCKKEKGKEKKEADAIPVKIQNIQLTSFTEKGEYYGTVQGIAEARLVSYTGGSVKSIKVRDGDNVGKDQKLCDIEGEKYQLLWESARLAADVAKREYGSAQKHLEAGSFSQVQLDKVKQGMLMARHQELDARKHRDAAWCISPISGIVVDHFIEPNQDINPGTPTIAVARLDKIKVIAGVPESEIEGYARGNLAEISLSAVPGKIWEGTIHSISRMVRQQNRSFNVEVRLANKGGELLLGQTVKVVLSKTELENQTVIPSESILNLEKGTAVMVVNEGIAKRVMIEKGPNNKTHTVAATGLNEGDQLIISGQTLVANGAQVKVVP